MAQAMVVVNSRMEIAAYNKKFLEMFGFEHSEVLVGNPFQATVAMWRARRATGRESVAVDDEAIREGISFSREYWQVNENGDKLWVQLFHNPLPGGGFVRTYTDITDRKRYELDLYASREKLAVMAATDELSGALNRRSGFSMLKQLEKDCRESRRSFAVCFLDIDDLKKINDKYGHSEGDELIRILSMAIQRSIRSEDAVCRVGGDEFMILFPGCDKHTAQMLVERIRARLDELTIQEGKAYAIRFSYGVEHMIPEKPMPVEELIRRADREMYRDKTTKDKR
jgi:diguanylate cyclase (GGDEF)-like protein/PAS domain S-box-containing protein